MNPLNTQGEIFDLGLMNPNPKSKKTKDGPVYSVSFEVEKEVFDWFMESNTKGMLIACKAMIAQDGQFIEPEAPPEPKKEKGPYGNFWNFLYKNGIFNVPELKEYCLKLHHNSQPELAIKVEFGVDSLSFIGPNDIRDFFRRREMHYCALMVDRYLGILK